MVLFGLVSDYSGFGSPWGYVQTEQGAVQIDNNKILKEALVKPVAAVAENAILDTMAGVSILKTYWIA